MVDPSKFFKSGQTPCARCGKVNDLGSSETLYWADDSLRCKHCGFLFIRHKKRQMDKTMEMARMNPEWVELMQAGRNDELKRRLDELVPIEDGDDDRTTNKSDGDGKGNTPKRG